MTRAVRSFLVGVMAGMTVCVVAAAAPGDVAAQEAKAPATAKKKPSKPRAKAAAEPKKDAAEAQKAVDAGIRAFQSGKNEAAIGHFDSAIANGNLPASQVARALYYRGLAHRKVGKSALAISDLTNALWLKGGLSEQERAEALAQRSQAYREAGLAEPPGGDPGGAAPASRTTATPRDPTRTAAASETASDASPSSSSGFGNFFSNLFSGSSAPPAAALTSDGAPGAPAPGSASPPSSPPAKSVGTGWSSGTEVQTGKSAAPKSPPTSERRVASRPVERSAPHAVTTGALSPAAPKGIRVHVATLPTREAAQAVVERIKREHGAALAAHEPAIDELASPGARHVFTVRIGPFANAEESRELCAKLRKSGLECSIVAR
jgi:cell division septation protein DedD